MDGIDDAVQVVVNFLEEITGFAPYFYYFNLTGLRNRYAASVSAENEM